MLRGIVDAVCMVLMMLMYILEPILIWFISVLEIITRSLLTNITIDCVNTWADLMMVWSSLVDEIRIVEIRKDRLVMMRLSVRAVDLVDACTRIVIAVRIEFSILQVWKVVL